MEWLNDLNEILPVFFCRKDVGKLTGGVVSPKYLANLDSLGLGPKDRFVALGRVCYHRKEFIDWFVSRVKHAGDVNCVQAVCVRRDSKE